MPGTTTNDPALLGAVAGGILALGTRGLVYNGIVAAHEGGHAITAVLFGCRLKSVRVNVDGSGVTKFMQDAFWPARVVVSMAGYASPPLVGLGMLWAILHGRIQLALLVGLVLLLLSVPFWQGLWTIVVGTIHVAVFTAALVTSETVMRAIAGGIAAVGLVGGIDCVVNHARRPGRRGDGTDFSHVAEALLLPMVVARALFVAVGLATGGVALWLLLGDRLTGTGP